MTENLMPRIAQMLGIELDVDFKIHGDNMWIITSDGQRQRYPGKTIYIGNQKQN